MRSMGLPPEIAITGVPASGETTEGFGTTFRIYLPMAQVAKAA